jgi:hypothetical protein
MLAVGRALMSRGKLMLLDEPSMGLSPVLVRDIFKVLREINKSGTTILLVEQNANMALRIANRAYVLETGNITISGTGQELKQLIDRIQEVTPLLGDEIVFVFSTSAPGAKDKIPMVVAEVRPGKQAELASAMDALHSQTSEVPLPYSLSDTLMVLSDSQAHLQWVLGHLGQGASTPFAEAIAARYRRGACWLLGMDMEPTISAASNATEAALAGAQKMRHLFLEQRTVLGAEQNEVTLTFKGPRMGMASWLASSGSGGAAEYVSADSTVEVYASTREPRQLFEELTAQLAKSDPSSGGDFAAAEAKLGAGFAGDIRSATVPSTRAARFLPGGLEDFRTERIVDPMT